MLHIITTTFLMVLLSGWAIAKPGTAGMGMVKHKGGFLNPQIIKELNLSDAQKKELREYRHEQKKKKIQLFSDIAQAEEDLKYAFSQYPIDKNKIEQHRKTLVSLHSKMVDHRVQAMLRFLGSLSKEQHAKFVELQEKYMAEGRSKGFKDRKGNGKRKKER